jgi:SAM-dependent methyltransferase
LIRDIKLHAAVYSGDISILNVGSHGNEYGLPARCHFHVDIVAEPLQGLRLALVADAEALPFPNDSFDLAVCVGSVVNYCNAAIAIREFGRVLRPGGRLILEFETSDSFEFYGTPDFSRDAVQISTFYNGEMEPIYVYAKRYIVASLKANGFRSERATPFHLLSPLAYRAVGSEQISAMLGALDGVIQRIPLLRDISANVFVTAKKL